MKGTHGAVDTCLTERTYRPQTPVDTTPHTKVPNAHPTHWMYIGSPQEAIPTTATSPRGGAYPHSNEAPLQDQHKANPTEDSLQRI